jgi:hypothetical protein
MPAANYDDVETQIYQKSSKTGYLVEVFAMVKALTVSHETAGAAQAPFTQR